MATDPTPNLEDPVLTPLENLPRAPGEMTLIEHLRELRNRVMVCAIVTFITILLAFWFRDWIFDMLMAPGRDAVEGGEEFKLVSFSPTDRIVVTFKLCLFVGVALASPVIIYEIMAFVIPGLTPKEKRLLMPSMLGVAVFMLAGMAFAYFIIIPASLGFLLNFESDNFANVIGAQYYIDFVTRLVFFVGLTFEIPMVLALLAKLGILRAGQLVRFWRYAIVIIAIIAAVATPTPDMLTMSLVVAPLLLLYVLGILFAWVLQPAHPRGTVAA
jgi:sec-independent protein translocase protein TatC